MSGRPNMPRVVAQSVRDKLIRAGVLKPAPDGSDYFPRHPRLPPGAVVLRLDADTAAAAARHTREWREYCARTGREELPQPKRSAADQADDAVDRTELVSRGTRGAR